MSGLNVTVPVDADTTVEVGGDADLAEIVVRDTATGSEVTLCGRFDELTVLVRAIVAGMSAMLVPEPRGHGSELDAWERSRAATRSIVGETAA